MTEVKCRNCALFDWDAADEFGMCRWTVKIKFPIWYMGRISVGAWQAMRPMDGEDCPAFVPRDGEGRS